MARATEERRSALTTRITAARDALAKRLSTLNQDRERAVARLKRLAIELDQARALARQPLAMLRTKAEGLRPQAGDAALRAAGLKQRFGLSEAVPFSGTTCSRAASYWPTRGKRSVGGLRSKRSRFPDACIRGAGTSFQADFLGP